MNVEILIVSYLKDKPWLEHCLRSIRKFAIGFSKTTLLVPGDELDKFFGMKGLPNNFVLRSYNREKDQRLWHLHHQLMKCRADELCPNAEFIFHTDSDCIFTENVDANEYFDNGKPILWVDEYARLGNGVPWKPVVDNVMGGDNKFETMRRHGAIHYRAIYKDLRDQIEVRHKQPFDQFVLAQKADFPWGFTEFNMLGCMALSDKWRSKYAIVEMKNGVPKNKITQFWSHAQLNQKQSTPLGEISAAEAFKKLGV